MTGIRITWVAQSVSGWPGLQQFELQRKVSDLLSKFWATPWKQFKVGDIFTLSFPGTGQQGGELLWGRNQLGDGGCQCSDTMITLQCATLIDKKGLLKLTGSLSLL